MIAPAAGCGAGKPIVAVVGPTASGKSALAIGIAERFDGEIVSADSMQIYRGMDIGTGKVPAAERKVAHHGLDIADPGEPYSASLFQAYARACIEDIEGRSKLPIVCGGTGFYVRAVLDDFAFPKGEQEDNPVRERYQALADKQGSQAVWDALAAIDPESASRIHPNNTKRVIRALEIHAEGGSYAELADAFGSIGEWRPALYLGLDAPRDLLYRRIEERVDQMLSEGLIDEVRHLDAAGFKTALTSAQAIGYKEIYAYLHGETTLDQAVADIKQATRRYAKRQISWFKRDRRIHWLDASESREALLEQACAKIGEAR